MSPPSSVSVGRTSRVSVGDVKTVTCCASGKMCQTKLRSAVKVFAHFAGYVGLLF